MTLLATLPDAQEQDCPMMAEMPPLASETSAEASTDALLLRRFLHRHDKEAFTVIVRRHGPMVLRTCQRVVGQAFDADDAFQATFMVLVRKASSIQPPEMLGPWLHGVAYRCAQALRQKLQRQKRREQTLEESYPVETRLVETLDWLPYLDQEIARLPEIYRRPVILCELEGRGRTEAAQLLGVAEGTLSSRLAHARKRLCQRLGKRGLLSVTVFSSWAAMNSSASAALPERLVESTTQLGMYLLEQQASLALPPAVADLTQGAVRSMLIKKIQLVTTLVASFGCISYGCWFLGSLGAMEPVPHHAAIVQPQDSRSDQSSASGSSNKTKGSQQPSSASADSSKPGKTSSFKSESVVKTDGTIVQETVKGSGNIATETRSVSGYNKIQLLNAGKILIKQTDNETLSIKTDDNLLPLLVTETHDGVLVLKNKTRANLKPTKDIEYVIEVKELGKLEVNGAGSIVLEGIKGKQLDVHINGAASINITGQTSTLKLELAGSGSVNGEKFTTQSAQINIPGSGSVVINAKESLKVNIHGSGSVQYVGDPKVTKSITGVGSVRKMKPKNVD